MKKTLCVLLCAIGIFSLWACARTERPDSNSTTAASQQPTVLPTTGSENTKNGKPDALPVLPEPYALILDNIVKAYPWNDYDLIIVPENPELSYMYRRHSDLSEIGFSLMDLDGNGQEELIISAPNSFVYDLYTISDGKAVHLFDSGERYAYTLRENGWIENTWSGSAATSGHDFYKLNDGKLEFAERITLDAYHALDAGFIKELPEANGKNTCFISTTDQFADYKLVTFDEMMEKIDAYQKANKELEIEYTLLSDYQK